MAAGLIKDKLLATTREISITGEVNAYLDQLNRLICGEAMVWLSEDPSHIAELLTFLKNQNMFIPGSFSIVTSKWLWKCWRAVDDVDLNPDDIFYQTRGDSDDDTFLKRPLSIEGMSEKLFVEIHRKGGHFEFKWEPFGSRLRLDREVADDTITTES